VGFSLTVPHDAQVLINGRPTKSHGTQRNYVARGVQPGYTYDFHVRVEVVRDGRPVSSEQTLRLSAGEHRELTFSLSGRSLNSLASVKRWDE
jgi:uncharacterized protein (TIGR03000 family)